MNSTVLFVVVLATSCLMCEAGFFSCSREPAVKQNAVEVLGKKLSKLTDSLDLAANVNAALKKNWEKAVRCPPDHFFEAVKAFKRIRPEETCHSENIRSALYLDRLGDLSDFYYNGDNGEEEDGRVIMLLNELRKKAQSQCFVEYEKMWNEDPERTKRFASEFPELVQLSELLSEYKPRYGRQTDSDIIQMDVVTDMITDPTSHNRLKGAGVLKLLSAVHQLKGNKALDYISAAEAEELIQLYLVKPCEGLKKKPEVETIFGPLSAWSSFVFLLDDVKQGREGESSKQPNFESILWSARWSFCHKVLRRYKIEKLAERVSKASSEMVNASKGEASP